MTHEEMILQAHNVLFKALPECLTDKAKALIEDAYIVAKEAHGPQLRESGEPYILHPLAVALIVVKEMLQRDPAMIMAALLHDVVENCASKGYTIDFIRNRFGDKVAFLVGAVTKPNKDQVESLKHIFTSMRGDVHVLFLKIASRIHNLRTLRELKPEKRWRIASESQLVYGPLAGRLGMFKIKTEIENLAFKFLNPQEYERIERLLEEDKERTRKAVEAFQYDCVFTTGTVFIGAVGWDIRYRLPYSIWRDMEELGCDFYHVPFKHYIRAVYDMDDVAEETSWSNWDFTEEQVAMTVYSTLVSKYREKTGSLVNYLYQPKANGYKSLHFRLLNPHGGIEEIHVSSTEMRLQAEYGCLLDPDADWVKRVIAELEELAKDNETLLHGIRDTLFNEDVVVYTPNCQAIILPKGASVIDFAYELDNNLGNHARYARINGKLASISTRLRRGDCVEIVTSEDAHPTRRSLESVVTRKAKANILNYLRKRPVPKYDLCTNCHPLPYSEIIGFREDDGRVKIHRRSCPDAIRTASAKGRRSIVAVDDFEAQDDVAYPVQVMVSGVDRRNYLADILACIVRLDLSMSDLACHAEDYLTTCSIDFEVHSEDELDKVVADIKAVEGVEEVKVKMR